MRALLITHEVPSKPIREIEADTVRGLMRIAGIDWGYGERVHGPNSRAHDFVLLIDEEAGLKRLPVNNAATMISGYPGNLRGNILILSEGMTQDGMDFMTLSPAAAGWIMNLHPFFAGIELIH